MSRLADLQACVRHALLTGDAVTLEPLLTGGRDARKRLAIHQRHYATSLITVLQDRFPATVWLVGSVLVREAARRFVRLHPPVGPCIAEYGDEFPAHLAALPEAAPLQYLRDFAELERRVGQVAIEVDRPAVPITDVAAFHHETLTDALVDLQPGLRYWHASWPVDELFRTYLTDSAPDRFEMNLGSVYIEVRGARGDVCIDRLSLGDFTFRTALVAGRSLGQAINHSLEADRRFDPSQAFVTLLAEGFVTRIDVRQMTGVQ
jgi:putative DNA-binding protein